MLGSKSIKKDIFTISLAGTMLLSPVMTQEINATPLKNGRLLKLGIRGNDVNKLQESLKKLNYFKGNTTKYYGTKTRNSVKAFQKTHGLSADGIAGKNTINKINKVLKGNKKIKKASRSKSTNIKYTKLLKVGSRGNDVNQLQNNLKKLGYFKGNTTKYYGSQTRNSVKAFQKSYGLSADGIAGKNTINKINSALNGAKPKKKSTTVSKKTSNVKYTKLLKVGSRGNDVNQLQKNLKKLGYFKGNTTKYYGSQTRNSVKAFQKAYGLSADGIAGKNTINKISSALNGAKPKKKSTTVSRGKSNIVKHAKNQLGVPYRYGGSSKNGFDCSGFTQYVYRQAGINIPRTSSAQAGTGKKISKANLKIGDLIIFSNTYRSGPSHTGIYLGNNNFIHASSGGRKVIISSLNNNYYKNKFSYGRRVN